jgi:hypothetical protein
MVVAEDSANMTPAAFRQSLKAKAPPAGVSAALQALWWAANENWDKAHRIVMNGHDQDCAWVHAYLHRVEGDLDNATYWYRQARRKPALQELSSEWNEIVAALLGQRR